MSCFDLTHAPVATAARAAATGFVSMSTRPDPEGSGTVEISHPEMSSSPDSVGLARAHTKPTTKRAQLSPTHLLNKNSQAGPVVSRTRCVLVRVVVIYKQRYNSNPGSICTGFPGQKKTYRYKAHAHKKKHLRSTSLPTCSGAYWPRHIHQNKHAATSPAHEPIYAHAGQIHHLDHDLDHLQQILTRRYETLCRICMP